MKSVVFVLGLLAVIVLYSAFLNVTPVHLNQDELGFSLNAYSIAKTGFDENGRFFPLYFWHLNVMWSTPIIVYFTALILKLFSLSEQALRLSSVIVGIIDIVLVYLLAKRIFKSEKFGLLAGVLLATTPVHFIQSRILLDNLYIVPFVLGWLLLLYEFLERRKPWLLLVSGLVLGFGFYSYHAARVMMPFYLLTTIVCVLPEVKKKIKLLFIVLIGFLAPLSPLIPWTIAFPESLFLDQVRYTGIYDTTGNNALSGIVSILSPESLAHRLNVFISYFNPIYLFLLGDASLIHSTSLHHPLGLSQSAIKAGVFLLPLFVLIPLGISSAISEAWPFGLKKRNRFTWLLVFGFFTAPIAGALAGDHYRYSRILVILPFAVILATYGVQFLLNQKRKIFRVTYYLLLVTILLHFSYFLYDYFTDYRIRSYAWMKYNIPDALENVISEDAKSSAETIYLDNRVGFIDMYWKFYLIKHDKLILARKTQFIDIRGADLEMLNTNSIIVAEFNNVDGQKEQIGPFYKVTNIFEPDGVSTFYIFRN